MLNLLVARIGRYLVQPCNQLWCPAFVHSRLLLLKVEDNIAWKGSNDGKFFFFSSLEMACPEEDSPFTLESFQGDVLMNVACVKRGMATSNLCDL